MGFQNILQVKFRQVPFGKPKRLTTASGLDKTTYVSDQLAVEASKAIDEVVARAEGVSSHLFNPCPFCGMEGGKLG